MIFLWIRCFMRVSCVEKVFIYNRRSYVIKYVYKISSSFSHFSLVQARTPLLFPLEDVQRRSAPAGTYLWIAATEAPLWWIHPGLATIIIVTKEQGQTALYIFLYILTEPHSPFSHFFLPRGLWQSPTWVRHPRRSNHKPWLSRVRRSCRLGNGT